MVQIPVRCIILPICRHVLIRKVIATGVVPALYWVEQGEWACDDAG